MLVDGIWKLGPDMCFNFFFYHRIYGLQSWISSHIYNLYIRHLNLSGITVNEDITSRLKEKFIEIYTSSSVKLCPITFSDKKYF